MRKLIGGVLLLIGLVVLFSVGPPQEFSPIEQWVAHYVGDTASVLVSFLGIFALLLGFFLLFVKRK